jgi:hypothetical protein
MERPNPQLVYLDAPIDTTCEQPIDDLVVGDEQVVLGD